MIAGSNPTNFHREYIMSPEYSKRGQLSLIGITSSNSDPPGVKEKTYNFDYK